MHYNTLNHCYINRFTLYLKVDYHAGYEHGTYSITNVYIMIHFGTSVVCLLFWYYVVQQSFTYNWVMSCHMLVLIQLKTYFFIAVKRLVGWFGRFGHSRWWVNAVSHVGLKVMTIISPPQPAPGLRKPQLNEMSSIRIFYHLYSITKKCNSWDNFF